MSAWQRLLEEPDWCRGRECFRIPAYSEFIPPPWVGPKPYGETGHLPGARADDYGWNVTEYEQEQQLRPGLEFIARGVLAEVVRLGRAQPTPHIARYKLRNNPYWPAELAAHAGKLHHERYAILLSVALSRTQDDKGRVRWTLFGASEQGPGRAFWRSFFLAPGEEVPAEQARAFLSELLAHVYGLSERAARNLERAGLRVLPAGPDPEFPYWDEGPLPSWCDPLLYREEGGLDGVRFLLTFRPFERLPTLVQQAYVSGELHLLPFPGSLVFWGARRTRRLQRQLPFAVQLPLLPLFARHTDLNGIRIPQSGWLREGVRDRKGRVTAPPEPGPDEAPGALRPKVVRTHRWQKFLRHQDEVALLEHADPVTRVLFSTEPDDLGLYGKPMAHNAQIWTRDHRLVLDGLRHKRAGIDRAERTLAQGGHFGYCFIFPAMRVGPWQVYWQRPIIAYPGEHPDRPSVRPTVLPDAPLGYLTAYRAEKPDLAHPVELWPRLLDRTAHTAAVELFAHESQPRWITTTNVRNLLEWQRLLAPVPLPASLARALLDVPHRQTLSDWLDSLPRKASDPTAGSALAETIQAEVVEQGGEEVPPCAALTFATTAERDFEVRYWQTIVELAHGHFRNKSNADCVRDEPTRSALECRQRQLDPLARHLLRRHREAIEQAGMVPDAWVGEHTFSWRTDFDFSWMGGWLKNQKAGRQERNVVVRIPGRDPTQAVIMADHYDTAYMHDLYGHKGRGTGARLAAAGADDNHSATAALLLAAPIFLELSKEGRLGCDVWLVHLTGEEFPADCLGARNLTQALVEGTLKVHEPDGPTHDLSGVRIRGVFVSDMIAHNRANNRYVFQIAPGEGPASAHLALEAHRANLAWNALAHERNRRAPRRGAGPGCRSTHPEKAPPLAAHAVLRGEVRPDWDPRSTLYNTDGQIFSDAGVPVVLFMEDYDINRKGYHDSHDTMANIDLDYGSALAAIVIETVARVARG
jgi:hypothetical protein